VFPADTRTLLTGEDEDRATEWMIGADTLLVVSLLHFAAMTAVGYLTAHLALW
jgi:hypothetical protein